MDANLTPKRKSILWNYDKTGNAYVIALINKKNENLKEFFDGSTNCQIELNPSDGLGLSLNKSGTKIWEMCDGLTTIGEMISIFVNDFKIDEATATEDIETFLKNADKMNIIDINWQSIF